MQIEVLLFATLREAAGQRQLTLRLAQEPATVAEVRSALTRQLPQLREHVAAAIAAVNEEFAFDDEKVQAGDTVAFFPPVSGGAGPPPGPEGSAQDGQPGGRVTRAGSRSIADRRAAPARLLARRGRPRPRDHSRGCGAVSVAAASRNAASSDQGPCAPSRAARTRHT